AVRRHLRGAAPLPGDRRPRAAWPHQADQARQRHRRLPRLVLPRPLNGIMDAPRRAAAAVPGLSVVDPPNARERGLCCGGGGGHMWMEVKSEKRVNIIRTEELLATGAATVATACPFCL